MRRRRWDHDEAELETYALEVAEEFTRARSELGPLVRSGDVDWRAFRNVTPGLPEMRWPRVWRRVYGELQAPLRRLNIGSMAADLGAAAAGNGTVDARRRDELLARRERTAQQAEDFGAELLRLEQENGEIFTADLRLWSGAGIVVAFAAVGVALPLWIMGQGPKDLASVRWLFWLFAVALTALLGYIVLYLVQLTCAKQARGAGRR